MTVDQTIGVINQRGHWDIIIRPRDFQQNRIPTLSDCEKIIESCAVRHRGWPYPIFKKENIISGQDWIDYYMNWQQHIEVWRFHQSGLFRHIFALREDWEEKHKSIFGTPIQNPRPAGDGLSILGTLYTLTEILEFLSKIANKALFNTGVFIKITLENTENRKLFFYDSFRNLGREYRTTLSSIDEENEYSLVELTINHNKIALEICARLFEKFNWRDIPIDILKKEQEDFLKGKF